MSLPKLTPTSKTSAIILPASGTYSRVAAACPIGAYTGSVEFLSGAAAQVAFTYKRLGGDVLDIELTEQNIYANFEDSVLEYSYLVNIHQAKNALSDVLGATTGTFNHRGEIKSGPLSASLSGTHVGLKFPKFEFAYARRVSDGMAFEAGFGGNTTIYSASFDITPDVQDYNLQTIISQSATGSSPELPYYNKVKDKKVLVHKVFYRTPMTMWRFYGYYGGLNVVGNLNYYGQYADDTTFEIIPVWQNKLQAMAYEDHLFTRLSHYSYELYNNNLRFFPIPHGFLPYMNVQFTIDKQPWTEDADRKNGTDGINNLNTLPFDNIPYKNINAIGKHWIRRYALALCKEMLGQIRGKFGGSIPIPGDNVTLNSADLLGQAKDEQDALKEELKTILDEMTYNALAQQDAEKIEAIDKVNGGIPLMIYQG